MKSKPHLLTTFAFLCLSGLSNVARAQTRLDNYLKEGLENNESIWQQNFLLEKSMYALQESKSLFGPTVTFSTSYVTAQGGRSLEFPAGDLLNQAYATLNQLTRSNSFAPLKNQNIQLFPNNFYDAHFRTSLPLLDAELIYNRKIRGRQADMQKTEVLLYKRELVKEIKTAYFRYSQAVNAVKIYETSLRLVEENRRINQALFDNQQVNRTAVIRSENEVSKYQADCISAEKTRLTAKAYFNFLLNKNAADTVIVDPIDQLPQGELLTDTSIDRREELTQLRISQGIGDDQLGLARSYLIPKISTYIDLGAQDNAFRWTDNTKYYFFGVSLDWTLFASGKNTYREKQAFAERQSISAQTNYAVAQLRTQLINARNAFHSSIAQYKATQSQFRSSQAYYRDELRLYKEGKAIYIELLDAQNQLINAELENNNTLFETWIRFADIERANAGFSLQ